MRFQFGQNWQKYVQTSLSEEKVTQSVSHLKAFLRVEDLRGKTFLDIGSDSRLTFSGCAAFGSGSYLQF